MIDMPHMHCELKSEEVVFIWLPRLVRGLGAPALTMLTHVIRRTYVDWDGEVWSEHYFLGSDR